MFAWVPAVNVFVRIVSFIIILAAVSFYGWCDVVWCAVVLLECVRLLLGFS